MQLELDGRVAVVTGASRGIGLAISEELVAEGCLLVGGSKRAGGLAGLERAAHLSVDLSDPEGPARLVDHAVSLHGRVDVLVNNVGAAHVRTEGFLAVCDEDFEASLQLNFLAAVRATRAAVSQMLSQDGGGTVVNVVSVNSFFEPDGAVIDYGAAKAALLNFAKSLSQELGPRGIRVTSVSPGQVSTDLWLGEEGVAAMVGRATGSGADAVREQAAAGIPTRRFSTPREVAALVALLSSPRTANVNGSNWVIDGGLVQST